MFYIKRVCNFIHSAGNLTEMNFFKAGEMKTGRIHNEPNNDGIVISGISGKFPKSKNMTEFASNLLNKVKKIRSIRLNPLKKCWNSVKSGEIQNAFPKSQNAFPERKKTVKILRTGGHVGCKREAISESQSDDTAAHWYCR